jgi:hypothetical protein
MAHQGIDIVIVSDLSAGYSLGCLEKCYKKSVMSVTVVSDDQAAYDHIDALYEENTEYQNISGECCTLIIHISGSGAEKIAETVLCCYNDVDIIVVSIEEKAIP